jgi:hypothetical protein
VIKVSSGGHAFLRESLFSHVLEGVNPGVHHIIERHTGLDFAVGEDFVFPLALRDSFALGVIQREAVRPFRRLNKRRMRGRRISDVSRMDSRAINGGGEKTDDNKGAQ